MKVPSFISRIICNHQYQGFVVYDIGIKLCLKCYKTKIMSKQEKIDFFKNGVFEKKETQNIYPKGELWPTEKGVYQMTNTGWAFVKPMTEKDFKRICN